MKSVPPALQALTAYPQFIIWKKVPVIKYAIEDKFFTEAQLIQAKWTPAQITALQHVEKTNKVPLDPVSLRAHNPHDPNVWLDAQTAISTASTHGDAYGVGFVFTKNDPFFFLDIDGCAVGSEWSPLAIDVMAMFPGAAVEVSQSGQGLHIFGHGTPPLEHANKNTKLDLELYTDKRFVALTGLNTVGDAGTEHSNGLNAFCGHYMQRKTPIGATALDDWTTEPTPDWDGPLDDVELITKALGAQSVGAKLGGRASFKDLWECDVDKLAHFYPTKTGLTSYDASDVDLALAQHLAFWTGKNCERIKRLMLQSALVRDKWEDRADYYLPRTITIAVSRQKTVYSRPSGGPMATTEPLVLSAPTGVVQMSTGYQFMTVTQQVEHFKDCFYITDRHLALTPNGVILKPDQFKIVYGGYVFAFDAVGHKTTKNAWEAFTESQAIRHPKVHTGVFQPQSPPSQVTSEYNLLQVNTFVPQFGEKIPGTVVWFVDHVKKMLPYDYNLLLDWMAFVVQNPGVKTQWAPVLQGVQGNGKSLFYALMEYAMGRNYSFQLNASDLTNIFNAWIERKMFICVEEIRVAGRFDVMDALKPLITNSRVAIQGKRKDQTTGDNCANFLFFSNYKDAVYKSRDDRRYLILYCAQQDGEDLARDGMGPDYFDEMWDAVRGAGRAHVAHYLSTREIKTNMFSHAPASSSTTEACAVSMGTAEQLVLDAIDMQDVGFRNDMLCTRLVDSLLEQHGRRLSPQAVSGVLANIGYVKHPALQTSEGKIRIDGTRRRLYVRKKSIAASLSTCESIASLWRTAQTKPLQDGI